MRGRGIYEDRGARISIMARVNAQGPHTLQQTGSRPTRKNPLADRGRAIHFGKDMACGSLPVRKVKSNKKMAELDSVELGANGEFKIAQADLDYAYSSRSTLKDKL